MEHVHGAYSCTTKELESRSQCQYGGDVGVEEQRAKERPRELDSGEQAQRRQSEAAGLRAKLQQRASATRCLSSEFHWTLTLTLIFFSLLTLALYVCSFHLTLFSLSLALAIGDDRGGSRGDVTGQGDRHLSTPYMYGLEGLRRCVRRGRDSRRDSWSVSADS